MTNRMQWKAETPSRQQQILRLLERKPQYFSELANRLGWSRQTLNLYLKALLSKEWIQRETRGRRVFYSINSSNHEVRELLQLDRVQIRGHIALDRLNEEEYIAHWQHAMQFTLLNIIHDFSFLGLPGCDPNKIQHLLEAHKSDLLEVVDYFGTLMVKRMSEGTLSLDKLTHVWRRLNQEIMNYPGAKP